MKNSLAYSFKSAFAAHVNGGMVLLIAAFLALIVANSALGESYRLMWEIPVHLQIGDFNLFSHGGKPMALMELINDALMVIFFFTVGLEIKREVLVGELSSVKKAMLPVIAAVGGMVLPVLIFFFMTKGTPAQAGMAVPMATDIAFSLGVLGLFSKRVPIALKVFLTAFAVVDDIGGILVLAIFYTSQIHFDNLLIAVGLLGLMALANYKQVRNKTFYAVFAIVVWYMFLQSGVHATIAGVLAAFTVPATPGMNIDKYVARIKDNVMQMSADQEGHIILGKDDIDRLKSIESASDNVVSPLQRLEDNLHGFVNYFIMPVFAFANAGIVFVGEQGVKLGLATYAAAIGLVVGKLVGIYLFTYCSIKWKITDKPEGMTLANLAGIAMLGGIGFTMSLFLANLSFSSTPDLLAETKLGILLGTAVAGVLGCLLLHITLPKQLNDEGDTDSDAE